MSVKICPLKFVRKFFVRKRIRADMAGKNAQKNLKVLERGASDASAGTWGRMEAGRNSDEKANRKCKGKNNRAVRNIAPP